MEGTIREGRKSVGLEEQEEERVQSLKRSLHACKLIGTESPVHESVFCVVYVSATDLASCCELGRRLPVIADLLICEMPSAV